MIAAAAANLVSRATFRRAELRRRRQFTTSLPDVEGKGGEKKSRLQDGEDEREFKMVQVQFDHWVQLYFHFLFFFSNPGYIYTTKHMLKVCYLAQ